MKKKIAIIGGGPSALLAAYYLSDNFEVHLFEKEKNLGRKFLVAGKGGFNLSNAIPTADLIQKYQPSHFLENAILSFDSKKLRLWLAQLQIPTYVGTSNRIFPEKGIKPVEVLRKIEYALLHKGVVVHLDHQLIDFNHDLVLSFLHSNKKFKTDFLILAMGGSSWKKTGSDGNWMEMMSKKGFETKNFAASNCGLEIDWPIQIKAHHEGKPLKNISIQCNQTIIKGEALISEYGLEANAIYPIAAEVRKLLDKHDKAEIAIDFKPFNTKEELLNKINNSNNYSNLLNINTVEMAILKAYSTKDEFLNPILFVEKIKSLKMNIKNLRPLDEAISTVGGLCISNFNADFSFKKNRKIFAMGEMVDWDAPTGGFLLQGCFSSAFWIAKNLTKKFA